MGLSANKKRKKIVAFETQLKNASDKLKAQEINCIQFLNILVAAHNDNPLVNEEWGINWSRIDVLPDTDGYDEEDVDSEHVTSESE